MTDAEFGAKVLLLTETFGAARTEQSVHAREDGLRLELGLRPDDFQESERRSPAQVALGMLARELLGQAVRDVMNEPLIRDHAANPTMAPYGMERDR